MSLLCPICRAPGSVQAFGRIAPFILQLRGAEKDTPSDTTLCCCGACDLTYFSHRFDDETLAAMYSGYRNKQYLSIRRRWEPWYSRNVNSATEPGSDAVVNRVAFMTEIVGSHIPINDLRNIIDYGGDEGQFFPPSYSGPKFVIEVSGKALVEGVQAAPCLEELPSKPHLVIAAHILEHLVEPTQLVERVRAAIANDGLFYVEVPLDRPIVRPWHGGSPYRRYLGWVSTTRGSWIAADFASGIFRNFGRRVPRFGAVKQSEHINYFSTQSLRALLTVGGFRVISTQADPAATVGGLRMGRLGVLAVPQ